MPINIEYYLKLNNSLGVSNKKEIMVNKARQQMEKKFEENPLSFPVKVNGVDRHVLITSSSKDEEKKIISKHDEPLSRGDVIEWDSKFWLLEKLEPYHDIFTTGTILEGLSLIKWLDNNGNIQGTWVSQKSQSSNIGVDEGRVLSLPDDRRNIIIQNNEDTSKIVKNSRFILEGGAWKVVATNKLTSGLIYVTLEEDLINKDLDNVELGIADYYNNIPEYDIQIVNGSFVTINEDQTLQLNVNVTNRSIPVTSPVIEYTLSDANVASVDSHGLLKPTRTGSVIVTALYKNVSTQIEISITESTAFSYTCEIIGSEDIKVGRTQVFKVKFYRNGIEYPDESKFSLTATDGISSTNLASISTQDNVNNACAILASQNIGYIKLYVTNLNGLSVSSKNIRIKPLY